MPIRILDLQLIYGVAGAREKFEAMVKALILSEYPEARGIHVSKGDRGIDTYDGYFTGPIDVFQSKFFPGDIGDCQKEQIRDSFSSCSSNPNFSVKSWTLCLPRDLTFDEANWFDHWRQKQSIPINTPWTATKLENLLMEQKNAGIKESFFKQEYLTQIREIHALLTQLVADFNERAGKDIREMRSFFPLNAEVARSRELEILEQLKSELSDEQRRILLGCTFTHPHDVITKMVDGTLTVVAGKRELFKGADPSEVAKWESLIIGLEKRKHIRSMGCGKFEIFEVGYVLAQHIRFEGFSDAKQLAETGIDLRDLLLEATQDVNHRIVVRNGLSQWSVRTNGREFCSGVMRDRIVYIEGTRLLAQLGLVREIENDVFEVIAKGFEVAKAIAKEC